MKATCKNKTFHANRTTRPGFMTRDKASVSEWFFGGVVSRFPLSSTGAGSRWLTPHLCQTVGLFFFSTITVAHNQKQPLLSDSFPVGMQLKSKQVHNKKCCSVKSLVLIHCNVVHQRTKQMNNSWECSNGSTCHCHSFVAYEGKARHLDT